MANTIGHIGSFVKNKNCFQPSLYLCVLLGQACISLEHMLIVLNAMDDKPITDIEVDNGHGEVARKKGSRLK